MARSSRSKHVDEIEPVLQVMPSSKFTGMARSVICYNTHGMFRNFKIVTLQIKDGVVVSEELSDPYASFEAIVKLELANVQSVNHLNQNWKEGETLSK